jgi:hypothetical protein
MVDTRETRHGLHFKFGFVSARVGGAHACRVVIVTALIVAKVLPAGKCFAGSATGCVTPRNVQHGLERPLTSR